MSSISHLFRRSPLMSTSLKFTRSPREIHYVREGRPMNNLKVATKGAVSPYDSSKLRVDAGLTHNPPKNTAFKVILLSKEGLPSDSRPIYGIAMPRGFVDIKKSHFYPKTDKESETFFEQSDVKQNMNTLTKNNNDDQAS